VAHYSKHLDRNLIDEAIGVFQDRKRFPDPPHWPVAVVPVLDKVARQRDIPVPPFESARRSA
jgi:hypothetical protein